ncbi:Gfo/Idh/MocA family oxidoreductase [candidate division KSB1 bacterium]|nr:Gfo/Idh/MocA family oxidoreductase [candidate division KSB1 bacterium]
MSSKIAVVGCGYWGKNLVRNFRELDALAMVCDATCSGIKLAEELAPGIKLVENFDEVLNSDVQGVVIATPAETHFNLANQALEAGKDVFVEKPLAINYQEGAYLVELAQVQKKILMVGHVLEYHPAFVKLMELIGGGVLGKIQYIYSNRLSLGKIRREENILWSFAPHDIAIILRILGKLPFQVVACGGNFVQPNIADVTVTNLLFDNSVRAHIYVSWLHPFKEQRLVVIGAKKMASFDDVSKKLLLYDQRVDLREGEPIPIKGDGEEVAYSRDEPLKAECQAFLNALETREAPLTDGQSGLDVLRVLQAAQRSLIMNGQQVTIPENNLRPTNGNGAKIIRVVDEFVEEHEKRTVVK